MTKRELIKNKGLTKKYFRDWKKTKYGGWVENTASVGADAQVYGIVSGRAVVSDHAYVGKHAEVYGQALLRERAWVSEYARISGGAEISGDARVFGHAHVAGDARVLGFASVCGIAQVFGHAQILGEALICGNAQVYGYAGVAGYSCICGFACVGGGVWEASPLYIQGTRWPMTNSSPGCLKIGCKEETFQWWKEHGKLVAIKQRLSKEEIREYKIHLETFIKLGK